MKITPEIIEQINILYLELGVKKKVAEILGCSPSTVSKYIIPNFEPPASSDSNIFEGDVGNADKLIDMLQMFDNAGQRICEYCMLSEEEWNDLRELQKEIIV